MINQRPCLLPHGRPTLTEPCGTGWGVRFLRSARACARGGCFVREDCWRIAAVCASVVVVPQAFAQGLARERRSWRDAGAGGGDLRVGSAEESPPRASDRTWRAGAES